ncbi:hypothetical protein Vretimale_19031 [Volvox reticuliferus]|uniref:Uncharacterized protein n=1 Tax=Volvox reticuliferus TaxID=1737510 RepID=A0A8J4LZW6_9CHLO|nr:hypothetical protein Vretifemale_13167 [Volvox reticuliferus]GIM16365.1 hypothetical protein Vretimale_19031 [Volvox reticuliferus]
MTAACLESLIKSGAHMLNPSWLTVASNSHRTMHYNLQWVRELLSARINCLIEFSSRGRDGLVALHQRYFAMAERAIQDEVLREYDDEFARARQKVSLKYLAEKEHKSRSGGSTGASQFNGAHLRRGRGGGFAGHGFPPNRATAAVGSSTSGASAPGQN